MTGAGAAAGAGGAYATTRHSDNIDDSTHTDRSFPLSGGAVAPHSDQRPASSTYSEEATIPSSYSGITGLNTGTAGGTGADSSDAARANLGLARHSAVDHSGHSHQFSGDPCETAPGERPLSLVPGPHATVAANMLDPHVPGEFPRDDGLDPHHDQSVGGIGHSSQPSEPASSHHLGRDATLVGGAGAAGLGAHEALKDHSSPAQQQSSLPSTTSGVGYPAALGSHEALADRTLPPQQPAYSSPSQSSLASGSAYPTSTQPETSSKDSHLGRNAALAGGAGAAGLGAYAATRDHNEPNDPQLSQGSSTLNPSTSQSGVSRPIVQSQSPQHVAGNPLTGAREPQKEHHYGRDAGIVGGTGAAGYGAHEYLTDRNTADRTSTGRDGIVTEPTTGLPMNVGKYGTGTGGTDGNQAIAGHYADHPVGSDPYNAQQRQPLAQDKEHHYGRDAALAGGAGAAGYGAYEYSKDRHDPTATKASEPLSSTSDPRVQPGTTSHATTSSTTAPQGSQTLNRADPRTETQPLAQDNEHHYGRNAALAGGAGAAGAAGYSALQNDRQDTGPASKTIGPHSSNIANIVDPRVQPEPEKMKQHTTAGPWQSDTLNKLDPKVESDPNKADVKAHGYASGGPTQSMEPQQQQRRPEEQDKDHHYGRDAAVVGGTGAAAYGATQAYDKHEQEKLAKEQEKQAQHDAKEHAKEQEKQAKHDAKEQDKQVKHDQKEADKQAKHDAHEAEKARKKEEEKHAKEQEKLEKQHSKEAEKLEKQHSKEAEKAEEKRLKEQEKAEKEHQKELEKLQHDKEKEDAKLASARYDEAEAKHNKHNKLHKEAPEEREDKGGIFHRIFHHKHYEREGVDETNREGPSFDEGRSSGVAGDEAFDSRGAPSSTAQTAGGQSALGKSSFEQPGMGGEGDGMVTEPTTGLPMNVGKYGTGTGGTDANEAIAGHYAK